MMMNQNSHRTFAESYLQGLGDLLAHGDEVPPVEDPTSVGSRFGKTPRRTLELLGYSFEVTDPTACLALTRARPLRLAFCYGLFVWTLAGSDDADWISYYNPHAHDFSDDGIYITAAFGKRLFANPSAVDQFDAIAKRLALDPQSRRTVATIASPEDNRRDSRDYPCAVAIQFFLREQRLHAITYMRSQSALMVLPYDAFLFMTLQCWLASRIGAELGSYRHIAGSFHVYDDEVAFAKSVLDSGADSASIGPMPAPETNSELLLEFERDLRVAVLGDDLARVQQMFDAERIHGFDGSFFSHARAVLLFHAIRRLNADDLRESLLTVQPATTRGLIQLSGL
jgi:thymidylate synthase